VQIQDTANIFGVLGTSDASMNGTFNFSVLNNPDGGVLPDIVPEPSSWVLILIGLVPAGMAAGMRRLRVRAQSHVAVGRRFA
jgi:hypothetical protein